MLMSVSVSDGRASVGRGNEEKGKVSSLEQIFFFRIIHTYVYKVICWLALKTFGVKDEDEGGLGGQRDGGAGDRGRVAGP